MLKNKVLSSLAKLIEKNRQTILDANKIDISSCSDIDNAMLDRLKINDTKIDEMINSVEQTISLDDPEGVVLYSYIHPNGMKIENKLVPFGNILIIYESRPDVTVEASIMAFKAGNKIMLKGGKEARKSNLALMKIWKEALTEQNLPEDTITYLDIDREKIQKIIKNNSLNVDIIIPRGGDKLIDFVKQNTQIPIIISGRGNNFLYIDDESDFDMASKIILNGKSRVSVCNALDKVLIHHNVPKENIIELIKKMKIESIEVLADENISKLSLEVTMYKSEEVLKEEFLSSKILLKKVNSLQDAIYMINKYSGNHSATIISNNKENAYKFQKEVDCCAVYHNVSTRFTDGGQFGFGAELAISTQKLHFRGPIGVNQLVTNKWFIHGNGQIRE